jgi:hypothetical protein
MMNPMTFFLTIIILVSAMFGNPAKADEKTDNYQGADCYGTVICADQKPIRCQTKLQRPAVRSSCTRHFGSDEGFVLCETFDKARNVVESERRDCGSTPDPSGPGAEH